MQVEWCIISRIKQFIGEINYNKQLGDKFKSLLDANDFDSAIKMIDDDKLVPDVEVKKALIRHIETYKYAC